MANPTFFPEGSAGKPNDTKRRVWAKICGAWYDLLGGDVSLAPKRSDTEQVLRRKTEYIKSGTTSTF
jgi:hypothetical protein